ncbi:hypothetical protein GvMRE_IIg169 [endosymbiont GvMRE of Glomus versiforme]|nr:hypothetical protein GvMRE_IIg169 [endosymbiont GvMRE of Glomus versiforme]
MKQFNLSSKLNWLFFCFKFTDLYCLFDPWIFEITTILKLGIIKSTQIENFQRCSSLISNSIFNLDSNIVLQRHEIIDLFLNPSDHLKKLCFFPYLSYQGTQNI